MNWLKKTWKTLTVTEKVAFALTILFLGLILSSVSANAATLREVVAPTVHKMTDGMQTCSAVMLAPGRAVTAAHCTDMTTPTLEVNGVKYPVTEAYANTDRDLAILIVPGAPCPCATVGTIAPNEGDGVAVVGYPYGIARVVTYGEVQARIVNSEDKREYVLTTASGAPGNSGGGVFDSYGYLVGILSMAADGYLTLYVEMQAVALTIPTK